MNQVKKKHQFQIRKVPLKRFIPEKTPQLYALDVHSICLPNKLKNKHNWISLNNDLKFPHKNYEQDFSQQILSSQAYKQMYSKYLRMRQQGQKQKSQLLNEIKSIDQEIQQKKVNQNRLNNMRDSFYTQIQSLRDKLTQQRDINYNLRWEVYNQRGTQYANLYGYSFLQANQLTYQELLQMESQMGNVNCGLTMEQIQKLDKHQYKVQQGVERQICCICYDEIGNQQMVTILKCKHTHHCDCIKDWLLKQKVCPICKSQVIVEQTQQNSQKNKYQVNQNHEGLSQGIYYNSYQQYQQQLIQQTQQQEHLAPRMQNNQ